MSAAVAVAGAGCWKAYEVYASGNESELDLLTQNIEALASGDDGHSGDSQNIPTNYQECLSKGGVWGYSSVYQGTKDMQVEGTGGLKVIWNGNEYSCSFSTKKGHKYKIPATEYKCVEDQHNTDPSNKNCCIKQGLYYMGQKLG